MTRLDLFKLFNNAVFGKTMKNLTKWINFEVVTLRKVALKRSAKPNFKHVKIFREDLVGIHMVKPVLVMNRPINAYLLLKNLQVKDIIKWKHYVYLPSVKGGDSNESCDGYTIQK